MMPQSWPRPCRESRTIHAILPIGGSDASRRLSPCPLADTARMALTAQRFLASIDGA